VECNHENRTLLTRLGVCSKYQRAKTRRGRERQEFREAHSFRHGRHREPFPENLSPLPSFVGWLNAEVDAAVASSYEVPEMVRDSSKLPRAEATAFRSMKAHGMHLRVRSAEEDNATSDSTVAATFLQPRRGT
jgi:hypothetical protein